LNRINWCDSQHLRLAEKAMPLKQLVNDVKEDPSERETYQKLPRSGHVCSGTVKIMSEHIAESAIHACIETSADRIQGEEADSAGARCPGERRRHRVQPGNELGHQQKR
jgi:hypothetical protein